MISKAIISKVSRLNTLFPGMGDYMIKDFLGS